MINLASQENKNNPFPLYKYLRENTPVCQVEPGGFWAITRYDDVKFALKHPESFSSEGIKSFVAPDWLDDACKHDLFIVTEDGEQHSKHRALVNKAFCARVIEALIPLMKTTASNLLQDIGLNKEVNFIEAFSYPYIGTIIGRIAGTEDSQDIKAIRDWIALTEGLTPIKPDDPSYIQALENTLLEQIGYFESVIQDRQRVRRKDLVSELVFAEIDGERLSDDMLNNALDMIIRSGFMTTAYLLSSCIMFLGKNQVIMSQLRSSYELIPGFIEEILRWQPPILATVRKTKKPVSLADTIIPKDALTLILIGSANRDAAMFDNAEVFDMTRSNNAEHLSFGYGPHVCIGLALAKLEVKIALETILDNTSMIRCKNEKWADSYLIRGLGSLPVTFT